MINMSYCRFENTFKAMVECYDALAEEGPPEESDTEMQAFSDMLDMCKDLYETWGDYDY